MNRLSVILALAAACAGCASTLTRLPVPKGLEADGLHPVETVEASNSAVLFLSFIPIASGDPAAPNSGGVRWFEETTTLDNQMKMLEAEASRVGATRAVNVETLLTDESYFLFLLLRETIHTSAVLVRDAPKSGGGGRDGARPSRPQSGGTGSVPSATK